MPADSFVGIWKFIARLNLCEPPTTPSRHHVSRHPYSVVGLNSVVKQKGKRQLKIKFNQLTVAPDT